MDLKQIELFIVDMDGTIYLDDELFDGAIAFFTKLNDCKKRYVFLTNNSSKSQNDYLNKLERLQIPATLDNIYTSGMAMSEYLNEYYLHKAVYLVGTKALKDEFVKNDIMLVDKNPEIVVVGFDRELTYQKLENACSFIDDGALFLATNTDYVCPIKGKRYIPDCGSICELITKATNKKPQYIGKPEPTMIDNLAKKYNIEKEKIAIIGDRIYTDIAAGFNAGVFTICVLSGESTQETIANSPIKPDLVVDSIKDLLSLI